MSQWPQAYVRTRRHGPAHRAPATSNYCDMPPTPSLNASDTKERRHESTKKGEGHEIELVFLERSSLRIFVVYIERSPEGGQL